MARKALDWSWPVLALSPIVINMPYLNIVTINVLKRSIYWFITSTHAGKWDPSLYLSVQSKSKYSTLMSVNPKNSSNKIRLFGYPFDIWFNLKLLEIRKNGKCPFKDRMMIKLQLFDVKDSVFANLNFYVQSWIQLLIFLGENNFITLFIWHWRWPKWDINVIISP